MATIDVKDAAGATVAIEKPLTPGRAAATASRPVVLSNEDAAYLDGIEAKLDTIITNTDRTADAAEDTTTPVPVISTAGTATTTVTRPADTTAYTADDALSDNTSAPTAGGFTFSSMGRSSGGSGILTDLIVVSSVAEALQAELWIFDSAPTAINDNAAWALSDTDVVKCVAKIPFTLVVDATSAIVHLQGLNIAYTCVGSANLRFLVKVKAAITPASATAYTFRAKFVTTN